MEQGQLMMVQRIQSRKCIRGKALKFRCFVTKENASQFPNLVKFIQELQSKKTYETISKMIKRDLANSYVRVEVICDREGFGLNHIVILKKNLCQV